MTVKIHFTHQRLDLAHVPVDGKRTTIYDSGVIGLCCRITQAGSRVFWHSRWADGGNQWTKIGAYPECTVVQARKRATEINTAVIRGEKPWLTKKALRDEATLTDLWEHYRDHASGKKKESSRTEDESLWRTVLEPWAGKKRIGSITRGDVQRMVNSKGKTTPTRANRVAALLSSMFNRAIAADLWKGANPAKGIERFREVSRDRFLRPDELRAMFASLAHEEELWKVYFMSALLCGARRSNLLGMRWADLDLSRGLWRVAAEESKNGQTMQIILPGDLQKGLSDWKRNCPSPVWCFPSDESASGHKTEPCKPWERVLARAECFRLVNVLAEAGAWPAEQRDMELQAVITEADRLYFLTLGRKVRGEPLMLAMDGIRKRVAGAGLDPVGGNMLDIRMHDLRRTLGSWASMTGASLPIIGKVLGHRSHQSTAVYARMDMDPARAAVEKAASAMLGNVSVPR